MSIPAKRAPRGCATSWQEATAILDWLEIDKNRNLIIGAGVKNASGVEAGQKLKKVDGYKALAEHINARFHKKWDVKICQSRYRALFKKYKDAKRAYLDVSGKKFGLTAEEIEKGMTVEEKLNGLCYCYHRWDALFGSRQNINPSCVMDSIGDSEESDNEDGDEADERIQMTHDESEMIPISEEQLEAAPKRALAYVEN
jgi:hypothetical protein